MLRKLAWLLVVLIALLLILWFGGRAYLARSVVQYDGAVKANVHAPVEITFDRMGVPQVWAKTDRDAHYALGWLHANERLFQMELVRRLAKGELSEVFGEAAFETDEFQRKIGFGRRARNDSRGLNPRARAAVQAYVDGINDAIAKSRRLPPEFVLLRFAPKPWTVEDCLAITGYQTWFSHALMDQDQRYQTLIEKLGLPATRLTRAAHPWSPPTVPDAFAEQVLGASRMRATTASNSWVIAPSRSQTGAALHASDPHLAVDQVPGLWYLAGLHSDEGLNVVGVTYTGAPFVVMGHNGTIAFSFTVASVDVIDYYDDSPAGARVTREEIVVKGEGKPRVVEVRETARGVLIDDKTSLKWAGFDFSTADAVDGALRLQKAKTFDEFRRAVTSFGAADTNWIYSDRAGNIGYQLGVPVPIRDFDTYARQKASDPKSAWRGYRPLDETPHALNPAEGFLATSNNQVVSRQWPYAIPGFYDPYRIVRAHALLGGTRKLGLDDMRHAQRDLVSGISSRWKSLAATGARRAGMNAEAVALERWNGAMSAGSREATLFASWWTMLPRAIFEDDLGADWKTGRVLLDEALTLRTPLLDDTRTKAAESIEDVAANAMKFAKPIAGERTWGEASTLLVKHPLARVKALDIWLKLNRGPLPAPGDPGTLDANFFAFDDKSKQFRSQVGPSMRFVLDWANVDAFTLTGALGQSGNPFSPHYDDFLPLMRGGGEWNVPFSREKVFASKASLLRLER